MKSGFELLTEFVDFGVKGICRNPEKVKIDSVASGPKMLCLLIHCDKSDVALIIGKQGRTINALRDISNAIAAKHQFKFTLMINE